MNRHPEETMERGERKRLQSSSSPDLVKIAGSRPGASTADSEAQANYADLYRQLSRNQRDQGMALIAEADPRPGEVVLDIGCGTGGLTAELAKRVGPKGKVLALDPDAARLALARAECPGEFRNLRYVSGRGEDLSWLPDDSLDLVYSNYVLHWVKDKARVMDEVMRCLRPGGRIAFELPGPLAPIFVKLRAECRGPNRELFDHVMPLTLSQWRHLMQSHGFTVVKAAYVTVRQFASSIEAFFDWWEATTHGAFRRDDLSAEGRDRLAAYMSGGREIDAQCVRVLAQKPVC